MWFAPHCDRRDVSFPGPVGRPDQLAERDFLTRFLCPGKGLTFVMLLSCPVAAGGRPCFAENRVKMDTEKQPRAIIGGVETHRDLHVAAVVDDQDHLVASERFATTRQGYRLMLDWMRSLGDVQRVGVEATGTCGAGVLRSFQTAGVQGLEVTGPDQHDRRATGQSETLDAEATAHAAFAERRTVTPRTRDGMIEALRGLKAVRKTAAQARRIALQMIGNDSVSAPEPLRDSVRHLTRMKQIRSLVAGRPDMTAYREMETARRIALKSLARRSLERHDEIADLDAMIKSIVDDLTPRPGSGFIPKT